jgi:hypothetical protein
MTKHPIVVASLVLILLATRALSGPPSPQTAPVWSEVDTATFRISVPTGWALVQLAETQFALLAPIVVDKFQLNVVITLFAEVETPASLDAFAARISRAHAEEPTLQERISSRRHVMIDGHAAERIVSVDKKKLQYMTTLVLFANRGYEIAAVAPAAVFATYQDTFARIADSLRFLRRGEAQTKPLPTKTLLMPAELGGTDVKENRTWLYPRAARAKAEFDARVRALVEAGETVGYSAIPQYEGEGLVPTAIRVSAQRPNGTTLAATVPNRPK